MHTYSTQLGRKSHPILDGNQIGENFRNTYFNSLLSHDIHSIKA